MLRELFSRECTGCNGDGFCADGTSTGDVVRSVAEDINTIGREIDAVDGQGTFPGEFTELVAIVVIVRESAELEVLADAVMCEFEFCTAFQVSGEQAESDVFACVEVLD